MTVEGVYTQHITKQKKPQARLTEPQKTWISYDFLYMCKTGKQFTALTQRLN